MTLTDAQRLANLEAYVDSLDPDSPEIDHTEDLASIAHAAEEVRKAEAALEAAITAARDSGRSWPQIALRLGVSRQAASKRWGPKPNREVRRRNPTSNIKGLYGVGTKGTKGRAVSRAKAAAKTKTST